MKEDTNKSAEAIREFWQQCDRTPVFASLLDDVLKGEAMGKVMLVASSELFPTFVTSDDGLGQIFQSRGLPYLSHRSIALKNGLAEVAAYQATDMLGTQREAAQLTQAVQEVSSEEFRDRLVIAALKTIQNHSGLRDLVNDRETITKSSLRRIVKDYSEFDATEFEELLSFMPGFFLRPKQKKALNRLTLHLDPLVNSVEPDYIRRWITGQTTERFVALLRMRRLSEDNWRHLLFRLLDANVLWPSVPLYLWCRRCPGVGFTASSMPLDCNLPPFCPSCGREAQALTAYTPIGLLREAMELTDGLLGAAIGWFLHSRKLSPKPALPVGGTECDFIFSSRTGQGETLVECKMHHVLSPIENIKSKLLRSRKQLLDHISIARDRGRKLSRAVCVVNLSAVQLKAVLRNVSPETDPEYLRVGAQLLSYEQFVGWMAL